MQAINIGFETDFIQSTNIDYKPQSESATSFSKLIENAAAEKKSSNEKTVTKDSSFEKEENVVTKKIVIDEKVETKDDEAQKTSSQGEIKNKKIKAKAKTENHLDDLLKQTNLIIKNIEETQNQKVIKESDSNEKTLISNEKLKWVSSSENTDYLSELIEDAELYVLPEDENFGMQLVSAQRQAVENPEMFLEDSEKEDLTKEFDFNVKSQSKKTKKTLSDVIDVKDLRTDEKNLQGSKNIKSDSLHQVKNSSNGENQITMELSSQAQKNILSENSQTSSAQGSTFQAMLSNQIQNNAADFVKAGSIVLKDNNKGSINLILHPESLGNVKINLELNDKMISGKIIVATKEAYEAFRENLNVLKQAFNQSGFDTSNFDVSFAGSQQSGNFAQGSGSHQDTERSNKTYGELVVENSSDGFENADIVNETKEFSINIVA